MKKIGILTFHYAFNFGAIIQTYALRRAIMDMNDKYNVEIINYKPSAYKNADEDIRDDNFLLQKNKIENFMKTYCGITSPTVSSTALLADYDYYITGSDQVWNPNLPVAEETGEYFLDFVPDNKIKIAYAASIGEPITKNFNIAPFKKNLPRFDFLSVREQSYVPFIEQFTNKRCHGVFDPTFIVDKKHYESIISKKIPEKKYILCVSYSKKSKRRIYDFVNRFSIQNNYKVIHMEKDITPYLFLNEEETIHYSGIEEILWTIKNASFVITDSFHYTVFSILLHRPFYAMTGVRSSRITDLLSYLHLENRLLSDDIKLSDFNYDINYAEVDKLISEKKELSLQFLKQALE